MSKPKVLKHLTVITGGARSGKSLLAEELAASFKQPVFYLATMSIPEDDAELVQRLKRHRERRPKHWTTHEVPTQLTQTINGLPSGPAIVLLDCFSIYLSNILLLELAKNQNPYTHEKLVLDHVAELIATISGRADLNFLIVTNEVGWGVVPDNALGRAYRDFLGQANMLLSNQAKTVYLVVAGQKLKIKP